MTLSFANINFHDRNKRQAQGCHNLPMPDRRPKAHSPTEFPSQCNIIGYYINWTKNGLIRYVICCSRWPIERVLSIFSPITVTWRRDVFQSSRLIFFGDRKFRNNCIFICFRQFLRLQALISDIVEQITTADELTKLVNKISNQRDPNQNEQISKELKDLTKRWNNLNVTVINRSNR